MHLQELPRAVELPLRERAVPRPDRDVGDRVVVAAARFSIADITAVVAVDFARIVKVQPGDALANVKRWRAAMALRPAMSL